MAQLGPVTPTGRRYVFDAQGEPLGWVLGKSLATSSRGAVKVWHWATVGGRARGTEDTRRDAIAQVASAAEGSSQK